MVHHSVELRHSRLCSVYDNMQHISSYYTKRTHSLYYAKTERSLTNSIVLSLSWMCCCDDYICCSIDLWCHNIERVFVQMICIMCAMSYVHFSQYIASLALDGSAKLTVLISNYVGCLDYSQCIQFLIRNHKATDTVKHLYLASKAANTHKTTFLSYEAALQLLMNP